MFKIISQDISEPDFVNDPYKTYKEFFNLPKIFFWKEFNMPVTQDYLIISEILKDKRFVRKPSTQFFNELDKNLKPFYIIETESMFENDNIIHRKLRSPFQSFFTKKKINYLIKDIEETLRKLLDKINVDEFDLIKEIAEKLPVIIISKLLGFPKEMHSQLSEWSNNMVSMYQVSSSYEKKLLAVKASENFSSYIKNFLKNKKKSNDLISHLKTLKYNEKKITMDQIVSNVILLFNAGNEATTHMIGNSIYTLLDKKYSYGSSNKENEQLINELIRYNPPLHFFSRFVKEKVVIDNHVFEEGSSIGLLLAAGNRDPKIFKKPNDFLPNRSQINNLSLGIGEHFCLGSHLAKLELQISLKEIYHRFPNLNLKKKPCYLNSYHFRGLRELKVKIF